MVNPTKSGAFLDTSFLKNQKFSYSSVAGCGELIIQKLVKGNSTLSRDTAERCPDNTDFSNMNTFTCLLIEPHLPAMPSTMPRFTCHCVINDHMQICFVVLILHCPLRIIWVTLPG